MIDLWLNYVWGVQRFDDEMIDWQRVDTLRSEIGAEDFRRVAAVFLQEADELVARLRSAPSARALEGSLHLLKGSAMSLGFRDLAQICERIEGYAAAGETDLPLDGVEAVYSASRASFLLKLGGATG